jgi:hypothetical protein
LAAPRGSAQEVPPVVDNVALEPLLQNCQRLLKACGQMAVHLPPGAVKELQALVTKPGNDPEVTIAAIQQCLDGHCLLRVGINPESRVKANRGPTAAKLVREKAAYVLIKVHNEAGVTHALTVEGPQLIGSGKPAANQWLSAKVYAGPPMTKTLSGQPVEYVLLELTARESGKREATLRFDAGQGTQELGFRAEVPILFRVREMEQGGPTKR